jgi:hypothetical protein
VPRNSPKNLAGFQGFFLSLDGLTALDADTAKALAEFKGEGLSLSGLTTLDADTAKAFDDFKGASIALHGLTTLSVDAARAIAAADKWDGSLPTVTAFGAPQAVAIAEALASRKGRLRLFNLKQISPKALSALRRKEGVEIPAIETLELIPEPDGASPRAS